MACAPAVTPVEISAPQQVSMDIHPLNSSKSSKEVSTPRSLNGSTCDGSVDDGCVGKKRELPGSSSDSVSWQSQVDSESVGTGVVQLSPRSNIRIAQAEEIRTFVEGAYTGDGFDPRWLTETAIEKRHPGSFSGDGSIANVGRNVSGCYQCTMCSQQFGSDTVLKCHMKFMHGEEEAVEWLPFPSA